jgi:hypothetical protein
MRLVSGSSRCPHDGVGDAGGRRGRLRGGRHQRRRRLRHAGDVPGAPRRRPAAGHRDRHQLARPRLREPRRGDRLSARTARPALAAAPPAPRLRARGADRGLPPAAPAPIRLRGDRSGAHRAGRRPRGRPAAVAAGAGASPDLRDRGPHAVPDRAGAARRPARRRLRDRHLRGLLRSQPGRPADRHLRAAAPRADPTAQRAQERAHHGGQRRRGHRLRDRGARPGALGGRRPGGGGLARGRLRRLLVRPPTSCCSWAPVSAPGWSAASPDWPP